MNKAVIFDLDGTLWDSAEQVVWGWNKTFEEEGVDKRTTVGELKSLMGKPMEAIIEALVPDMESDKRTGLLERCCRNEEQRLLEKGGILFPDLTRTLTMLRDEGCHLSIVSNCQDGYIETFLEHHKLQAFFDDRECPGRSGMLKAENIKLVIERNRIDKAVYVGDTQGDADASASAGVPFIWARYGFGDVKDAQYVIDSLAELPDVVREVL